MRKWAFIWAKQSTFGSSKLDRCVISAETLQKAKKIFFGEIPGSPFDFAKIKNVLETVSQIYVYCHEDLPESKDQIQRDPYTTIGVDIEYDEISRAYALLVAGELHSKSESDECAVFGGTEISNQ